MPAANVRLARTLSEIREEACGSGGCADLEAIQDYLIDKNPPAARRLVGLIRNGVTRLVDMPHRGRPGRWPGTRELLIPGTPYIIPYRVRGEIIEILHVWHGARRWPARPPRLGEL